MINTNYPNVIDEMQTIEMILKGQSIARYGDGEFNLMNGKRNVSQFFDEKLQRELIKIARNGSDEKCLIGIPPLNDKRIAKKEFWLKGGRTSNYGTYLDFKKTYYSSFVTRPDNIPYIDTPEFYGMVRSMWKDKDVILVSGMGKSLNTELMKDAKSVQLIVGPKQHAYKEIDRIEDDIGSTNKPVIMCLGATATVLAWRLSRKNIQAIDAGHIGVFLDNFEGPNRKIFGTDATKNFKATDDLTYPHEQ